MTNWITGFRRRVRGCPLEVPVSGGREWQKIAGLPVSGASANGQIVVRPDRDFVNIKLRSMGTDIDIERWSLEFHDGTILVLSIHGLLAGTESRPLAIAGRILKRVVIRFDGNSVQRGGRLEIWAQA
jgi:hypothetical protein